MYMYIYVLYVMRFRPHLNLAVTRAVSNRVSTTAALLRSLVSFV
jgi:hypothetical protein